MVKGELLVSEVPGSHLTIFDKKNLPGFVEAVERCLKTTEILHR